MRFKPRKLSEEALFNKNKKAAVLSLLTKANQLTWLYHAISIENIKTNVFKV